MTNLRLKISRATSKKVPVLALVVVAMLGMVAGVLAANLQVAQTANTGEIGTYHTSSGTMTITDNGLGVVSNTAAASTTGTFPTSGNNVNVNNATNIDRNFNAGRYPNGNWAHDPAHRDGVPYRNAATAERYGQNRLGAADRNQFRGQLDGGQRAGDPANRAGNARPSETPRPSGENRGGGAFEGMNRSGSQTNHEASRGYGEQSRASSWGNRGGNGGGGRGFGGGERGGGGRR